jgi:ParB-like chromosome segregation protein Spo0J
VSEPQSFPIEKIHVPEKKRKALKPEIVEDIAESILDIGQREAILVRREKDHFVLVEGLHRLEACKALGERAILGVLISAEAARQRELPPPPVDPEREKMERLRKLRLEKEAAEKLATASRATAEAEAATRHRAHPQTAIRSTRAATSKQSRSEPSGSTPRTLSDWIKQQVRSGGRY